MFRIEFHLSYQDQVCFDVFGHDTIRQIISSSPRKKRARPSFGFSAKTRYAPITACICGQTSASSGWHNPQPI